MNLRKSPYISEVLCLLLPLTLMGCMYAMQRPKPPVPHEPAQELAMPEPRIIKVDKQLEDARDKTKITYYTHCLDCGITTNEVCSEATAVRESVAHSTIHGHVTDVYRKTIEIVHEQGPVKE